MSRVAQRVVALTCAAIMFIASITCACANPGIVPREQENSHCPHHPPDDPAPHGPRDGHDHEHACQHCSPSMLLPPPRADAKLNLATEGAPVWITAICHDAAAITAPAILDRTDRTDISFQPPATLLRLRCALTL